MARPLAPWPLPSPGAALNGPTGLAIDDNSNPLHRRLRQQSDRRASARLRPVTTVFPLTSIALSNPTGVAVDPAGTLYIADTGNHQIVEATVSGDQFVLTTSPPSPSPPPPVSSSSKARRPARQRHHPRPRHLRSHQRHRQLPHAHRSRHLDTTDDPKTLTVQGTGNIVSTLTNGPSFTGANPAAFLLAPYAAPAPPPGGTFPIGDVCVYNLNFQPTIVGPNTANLVFTTTAAGGLTTSNTASPHRHRPLHPQLLHARCHQPPPTTPPPSHQRLVELVLTA